MGHQRGKSFKVSPNGDRGYCHTAGHFRSERLGSGYENSPTYGENNSDFMPPFRPFDYFRFSYGK